MKPPKIKNDEYILPLFSNPISRVLKFREIKKYLKLINSGDKILDYGSGISPYKELLESKFNKYISADYRVTNEKHKKKPDIYIDDEQKINIESNSIDCVFLTEVLEHIYYTDKALLEIFRVLKPGGYVIGSVPFVQFEHEIPFDYFRFTSFSLEKIFSEFKFSVIKLDYIGDVLGVQLVIMQVYYDKFYNFLRKFRLSILVAFFKVFFKIPEYIYVSLYKHNISFKNYCNYNSLPNGFTFLLQKPIDN